MMSQPVLLFSFLLSRSRRSYLVVPDRKTVRSWFQAQRETGRETKRQRDGKTGGQRRTERDRKRDSERQNERQRGNDREGEAEVATQGETRRYRERARERDMERHLEVRRSTFAAPMVVLGAAFVLPGAAGSVGVTPLPPTRQHTGGEMHIALSGLFLSGRTARARRVSARQGFR